MIRGCGECVLVSATVDLLAHQLLGSGVGHRPDRHIGGGQPADVVDVSCDAEVRQQDSLLIIVVIEMGEHDVGRFNVAVKQALFVGIVERTGHGGDDPQDLIGWHAVWIPAGEKAARIETVDVVHRDPQLPVVLAPVVDADDVRMPQF